MKTVIILPTYNEKENIGILVPLIYKNVPHVSILVVDDNSPDGTGLAVIELQKTHPSLKLLSRTKKEGLGKAYINAFSEVLKDKEISSIIMMDADLSHSPEYISELLKKRGDFGVVMGSRYIKGGSTKGWELWRRSLSLFANVYCRVITGLPVKDCTSGFNAVSAELLRKINFSKIDLSGYAFIIELKYLLYKADATFFEVPIVFKNRARGETKISGHIIFEGIIAPWKIRLIK